MKVSINLLAVAYKIMLRSKNGKNNPAWHSSSLIAFLGFMFVFSFLFHFCKYLDINKIIGLTISGIVWLAVLFLLNNYYKQEATLKSIMSAFENKSDAFWGNLEMLFWLLYAIGFSVMMLTVLTLKS